MYKDLNTDGTRIESSISILLRKLQKKLSPTQIVVLSFVLIITIGGFLLSLPISHARNTAVSVTDAFFTSISAVCVTGLVNLSTASTWSFFGKLVILFLIQIGGLSLVTVFTFFMVNIGKKISLKNRLTIQTALNKPSLGGMVRMVMLVIKGTLVIELVGALVLFISFLKQGIVWYKALFYGIFHAVSAFCNAGFDIIGDRSLIPYANSFSINVVIMVLIVAGGIGFTVWEDIFTKVKAHFSAKIKQRGDFSLHTKLALIFTGVLLLSGTLFFFAAEYNNPQTIGNQPVTHKLLASLFQSVTIRTAGFYTIEQEGLTEASKLFSSLYMIIGGSPGGTAGGIKTVTLAIVLCSVWSIIRGRKKIVVFERTISVITLQKALAVVVLMMLVLVPAMSDIYSEFGGELPTITKVMVSLSNFFINYWWVLLIAILGIVIGIKVWIDTPNGKRSSDKIVLKIPIIGGIISKMQIAQFTRILALLLGSGLSISRALELTAMSLSNTMFREVILEAKDEVEKGNSLALPIARSDYYPLLVSSMIAVGEETGELDNVLEKVAQYYNEEVDQATENMSSILEPVFLVIMGLVIAFISLGVYTPMFQLSEVMGMVLDIVTLIV